MATDDGYGKETDESAASDRSGGYDDAIEEIGRTRLRTLLGVVKAIAWWVGITSLSIAFEVSLTAVPWVAWVDEPSTLLFVLIGLFFSGPWLMWRYQRSRAEPTQAREGTIPWYLYPFLVFGFIALAVPNLVLQANASFDRSAVEVHEVDVTNVDETKSVRALTVTSWRSSSTERIHWRKDCPTFPTAPQHPRLRLEIRRGRLGLAWISAASVAPATSTEATIASPPTDSASVHAALAR